MRFLPDNKLIAWGTAGGALLTAATLAATIVIERTGAIDAITQGKLIDADHETRLRFIETVVSDMRADVRETKTNVSWIRHYLDRRPTVPAANPDTQLQTCQANGEVR